VPVCLSASHISYGSIRMEPVFMVMGQSAATAAVLAIESGVDLQKLDYAKLKAKLLADGQMLDFESPPMPEHVAFTKEQLGGIVVDDSEADLTGFTSEGHTTPGFVGEGYRHDGDSLKGEQKARFTPNLPAAGQYRVAITYTALAIAPNPSPSSSTTPMARKGHREPEEEAHREAQHPPARHLPLSKKAKPAGSKSATKAPPATSSSTPRSGWRSETDCLMRKAGI
jgi:hypothetical protein